MKELLRSHSLSYLRGVEVALEAQGIKTAVLDENAPGYMGFAGRARLAVLSDTDYDRAMQIVASLELKPESKTPPASWRLQRWGCAGLVLGAASIMATGFLSDSDSWMSHGLEVAAAVFLFTGMVLVVLGPRRDRSKKGPDGTAG